MRHGMQIPPFHGQIRQFCIAERYESFYLSSPMAANSQIYAFFGNDEAQVKEAALRLSEKIAPKDDEFGLEIVPGGADNADHATRKVANTIETNQTLPIIAEKKDDWHQSAK